MRGVCNRLPLLFGLILMWHPPIYLPVSNFISLFWIISFSGWRGCCGRSTWLRSCCGSVRICGWRLLFFWGWGRFVFQLPAVCLSGFMGTSLGVFLGSFVVAVEVIHGIPFSKTEGVGAAGHDWVYFFPVGLVHSGIRVGVLVLGDETCQTWGIH